LHVFFSTYTVITLYVQIYIVLSEDDDDDTVTKLAIRTTWVVHASLLQFIPRRLKLQLRG